MCISGNSRHYSGNILKKKEEINIDKIIQDIEIAAINAKLKIIVGEKIYSINQEAFYIPFKISDTIENINDEQNNIVLYLFSKVEIDEKNFDWISEGAKLIYIVNIENLYQREELVLNFLYEYLKLNPEDIFWNEYDWFYSYKSIEEIIKGELKKEWCYEKPKIM